MYFFYEIIKLFITYFLSNSIGNTNKLFKYINYKFLNPLIKYLIEKEN
jgi:hypothetical protein